MRVQIGQRPALYCRVSIADQSCERQERDLLAYAERCGYDVVGVFRETASTGTLTIRIFPKVNLGIGFDALVFARFFTKGLP
jgi:Resolvase, N terminal domain